VRRVVGRLRVVAALLALLAALPAVAWAADDPYRIQQWSLDRIGVEAAWDRSRGAGIVVAVIDTGVDLAHPDLRDRLVRDADGEVVGLDLVEGRSPADRHGHGTLVAGVIAATAGNGEGIAGVAPEASILPIRALDDDGAGRGRDIDTAIRWAVDQGADVINLSLESVKTSDGGRVGPGAPTAAVRYAWERGVPVVVAAGNNGASASDYPEDSPVVLVGASDRDDRRAAFSDRGRTDAVLAPGIDIVSTWCRQPRGGPCDGRTHTYGIAEGTSFAAPHVTGALALLLGAGLDAAEAVERLRATAVDLGEPGPDPDHGHGRIDVAAAMAGAPAVAVAAPAPAADGTADPAAPAAAPAPPAPAPPPAPAHQPDPDPAVEPVADGTADDLADVDGSGEAHDASPPTPSGPDDPVALPDQPRAVALPAVDTGPSPPLALQLLAAALIGVSLATWSSVARRLT
jgi:subtilisin family serine protease